MKISLKTVAVLIVVAFLFATLAYGILNDTRRVSGTSMLPTLENGDLVVVEKVPYSSIGVGDIVVYDPPCAASDLSVIHRVIQITSQGFITEGDNNPVPDQGSAGIATTPITQNCLVGKVVFVVPYVERLASLPYGLNYAIAALIIIFVIASELRPRRREEQKPLENPQTV